MQTYDTVPTWSWAALDDRISWNSELWSDEVLHIWHAPEFVGQDCTRLRFQGLPIRFMDVLPPTIADTSARFELCNFHVNIQPDG